MDAEVSRAGGARGTGRGVAGVNHVLAWAVWIAGCLALGAQAQPVYAFVFVVPFSLGPHAVSHGLCFGIRSRGAGVVLAVGMVAYAAWFLYVYADAFYFHPDAQSAIALAFIGVVSLPVMIPVWLVAMWLEWRARKGTKQERGVGSSAGA